ncbi:MAG: hypothetical protein EAX87_07900 [Candidatus Thorarchaeota archaeon]|nr:hypothetical protein [Candidatus Thorarchaeota archaeon]
MIDKEPRGRTKLYTSRSLLPALIIELGWRVLFDKSLLLQLLQMIVALITGDLMFWISLFKTLNNLWHCHPVPLYGSSHLN